MIIENDHSHLVERSNEVVVVVVVVVVVGGDVQAVLETGDLNNAPGQRCTFYWPLETSCLTWTRVGVTLRSTR